jgi:hypothetical protein
MGAIIRDPAGNQFWTLEIKVEDPAAEGRVKIVGEKTAY